MLHCFQDTSIYLCFAIFVKNFENSKWPPFLTGQNFSEIGFQLLRRVTLRIKNFFKITLSGKVFRDTSVFVFCIFEKNSKNQNGRHFWHIIYFLKLGKARLHRYPVDQKFHRNCSIQHGFRDTSIFAKNLIIQNGRHFWQVKYSLKLGKTSFHRYPVGQTFCRNRSILHGYRDKSIFVFCDFCETFKNSKWPPFLARQIFFENWVSYTAKVPCGSKISSKSLYLAQFSRYKDFCVLLFF